MGGLGEHLDFLLRIELQLLFRLHVVQMRATVNVLGTKTAIGVFGGR